MLENALRVFDDVRLEVDGRREERIEVAGRICVDEIVRRSNAPASADDCRENFMVGSLNGLYIEL